MYLPSRVCVNIRPYWQEQPCRYMCEISHENVQDLLDCLALQNAAYKNEPLKGTHNMF